MPVTKDSSQSTQAYGRTDKEKPGPRLDTTLVKGLMVLTTLTTSRSPMGVSALSEELGYGKSNIHRLLSTMVELGFVAQEHGTRRYKSTLKLWELGSVIMDRYTLRRASRQLVEDLHHETGNSIFVTILSGTDILYIEKIEASRGARSSTRPGQRVPAIFTAAGKVLVAHQDNFVAIVDQIIATEPEARAIDRESLLQEFVEIRAQGYAISRGGWTQGVDSISVIVPNDEGFPVASLGMAASEEFLNVDRPESTVRRLSDAARRVSELIDPQNIV